jgi:hypothetical protein
MVPRSIKWFAHALYGTFGRKPSYIIVFPFLIMIYNSSSIHHFLYFSIYFIKHKYYFSVFFYYTKKIYPWRHCLLFMKKKLICKIGGANWLVVHQRICWRDGDEGMTSLRSIKLIGKREEIREIIEVIDLSFLIYHNFFYVFFLNKI